jgi:hypothetical protein
MAIRQQGAIMEEELKGLEEERKKLYRMLSAMGAFRRGMISVNYRRCGKQNCICAQEGHPGHGPQYLWNATIKGKSYAKSIKLGPELQKYLDEIANHQRFKKLCEEIVLVNERICDLRPVPEVKDEKELVELKKKLQKQFMGKYKKR